MTTLLILFPFFVGTPAGILHFVFETTSFKILVAPIIAVVCSDTYVINMAMFTTSIKASFEIVILTAHSEDRSVWLVFTIDIGSNTIRIDSSANIVNSSLF